jgi:8-oxo-dGTP pyrophosphatase MutT (NUDIX family)
MSHIEYAHNRIQHCTNCGESGHIFRNCPAPVTSYGIIAVRFPELSVSASSSISNLPVHYTNMEFLLIQRKDSLSFLEFMRGKYSHLDENYISMLMLNMTKGEQQRLLTLTFDELWKDMWGGTSSVKSHKNNYETSERKYQLMKPRMAEFVEKYPSKWDEPEWGFPKGRRNPYESDIVCAIREFQEETGLQRDDFKVIQNTGCLTETFFGSNHVHYCHKYYFAICQPNTVVELNTNNDTMTREIGAIKWCTLDEAISKIRPDNIEKQEILLKAGRIMKNFYPILPNERV